MNVEKRGTSAGPHRRKRNAATKRALVELAPIARSVNVVTVGRYVLEAAGPAWSSATTSRWRRCAPCSRGATLMLNLPSTVSVFVAVAPLDMRGSFDALAEPCDALSIDGWPFASLLAGSTSRSATWVVPKTST